MLTMKPLRLLTLCLFVGSFATLSAGADPLGYHWKDSQKFSYQVQVTVDADDETITYNGTIHYTVNSASAAQATVTYRGGLSESKKQKQVNRGRPGPFGPRGFPGPPSFPSPFSKPTFTGKTQTTNKITISSRGATLAMEGDSQLPYLLGNVSLMPFEVLPGDARKQWTYDTGVSITEKEENGRDRFGPFGPGGPFGGGEKRSVQAAGEVANYAIQSESGDLVVIRKTYRLNTPPAGDNPAFDMTGTGTWTFDKKEKVPHAYDMKFKLTVKQGNSSTVLPISVKYNRISPEKLAQMEAEAKQKADELAQAAAAKKAMAEAPLTPQEQAAALNSLGGRDADSILGTLRDLAAKSLQSPDPAIAAAIETHLKSDTKAIADAAHQALLKWSPDYALRKSLAKAYQGPGVLKSTGLAVESITPLFEGQLVQAQQPNYGSFWRAAKVKKLLPDGRVELAFLTWGNERQSATVDRRNIQLAPPELEQPDRPAGMSATKNGSRTWSDVTGKFQVDAVFVSLVDGNVNLRRGDGKSMLIPLEKLSKADQAHVQQLQASRSNPANPFEVVE